jgi:RNA polymerase sigma-70 factor (ECF subfamily)
MKRVSWENRAPFFAFAARLMRRILVEHARAVGADKRGGRHAHVTLERADLPAPSPAIDSLILEDALAKIETADKRLGQIIELRFYAGLNEADTASVLGVSRSSVQREWAVGKRLLAELLKDAT